MRLKNARNHCPRNFCRFRVHLVHHSKSCEEERRKSNEQYYQCPLHISDSALSPFSCALSTATCTIFERTFIRIFGPCGITIFTNRFGFGPFGIVIFSRFSVGPRPFGTVKTVSPNSHVNIFDSDPFFFLLRLFCLSTACHLAPGTTSSTIQKRRLITVINLFSQSAV